jgi:energy-coupling factor transporter ATP-binding protein EcfA2
LHLTITSKVFPVEISDTSDIERPLPPLAPMPDAPEMTESHGSARTLSERDQLNHHCNVSFAEMPECAEKNLTFLHAYFKSERLRLASSDLQQIEESPTVTPVILRAYLERLLHQLPMEHLQSNQVDAEIKEFLDLFNKYLTLTNPLCREISDLVENMEFALFRALRCIAPLDINYLLNSVRSSLDTASLIKNKDIILLLGSTGAGKSTLMHFLAGSKMRLTEVSGIEHLEPEVVMTGLEDVTYSCSSRSETSGIHAITMHFEEKTYIVCDTAGLGDLAGPEQDITSGIVMTRAIRSAKSVKIVLFITQGALSDRYSNLRKTLVPSITRLIPSFGENIGSVFYLFNMISDRLEGVAARLRDFSSHLEPAEKADVSFAAMIRDLARKTQSRTHCTIADMTRGNNLDLLRGFDSLEAIKNPEVVFHDFAAPISINILRDQLNLHKGAIFKVSVILHNATLPSDLFRSLLIIQSN